MLYRGVFATSMSGAVDGVIAARNKGGAYFRNRTHPTDPDTTRQSQMRAAMDAAYTAWSALDDSVRQNWARLAASIIRTNRIGDKRRLSAWNEFSRLYTVQSQRNALTGDDAPLPTDPWTTPEISLGGQVTVEIVDSGSNMLVHFPRNTYASDYTPWLMIEWGSGKTAGDIVAPFFYPMTRNFFAGPYQMALTGNPGGVITTDPYSVNVAIDPSATSGKRIFWRVRVASLSHGLSAPQRGYADVP